MGIPACADSFIFFLSGVTAAQQESFTFDLSAVDLDAVELGLANQLHAFHISCTEIAFASIYHNIVKVVGFKVIKSFPCILSKKNRY
jgi:hypothetical protein